MLMRSKLHNLNIADAKLHQRHLLTACRNYRTLIFRRAGSQIRYVRNCSWFSVPVLH